MTAPTLVARARRIAAISGRMIGRVEVRTPHLVASAFCTGLGASVWLRPPPAPVAVLAVALAGSAAVAAARPRILLLALSLLACGLALGTARLAASGQSELARSIGEGGPAALEVTGPARTGPFGSRVPVRARELWHRPIDEPSLLRLPAGRSPPPQGAVVEVIAAIRAPRRAESDGGFDEATYLARHGVHAVLMADRYRVIGRRGGIGGAADVLRSGIESGLGPGLRGERRALVAGIVLGADEEIDPALREAFRRSGLYHLLAVSGQNVAYLAVGTIALAWLLGIPRILGEVGAIAAVIAYVGAVGWQPSVARAGIAGLLASLAWIAGRGRDRWYFALVGAAVLLAWNPYSLLDAGFQLSFAAVAAIFALAPRLDRLLEGYPLPRPLRAVASVSTACSLATAPILWIQFGALPALSVVANLLAAPVVAPILGLGLGSAALFPVLPGAAGALGWLNGWLAAYLAWVARLVGGLPIAQIRSPIVLLGGLGAGLLLVVLRRTPSQERLAVAVACALIGVCGWVLWSAPGSGELARPAGLRITVLDVGQGDSVLLQVPEGAVLVDEGPPDAHVSDQLDRMGVGRLAAIVLTHPQRDHVGGAAEVLAEHPVGMVLDPGQPGANGDEQAALVAAAAAGTPVVRVRQGRRFRLGGLQLTVLWPQREPTPGSDPNLSAVVILAAYGDFDALLTADAESDVTSRIDLPAVDVLKVAHHGSADPGLPRLLERIQPRFAVISCGAGNTYGHPSPSTVSALLSRPGIRLYRTDRDGRVVIETDGHAVRAWTGA